MPQNLNQLRGQVSNPMTPQMGMQNQTSGTGNASIPKPPQRPSEQQSVQQAPQSPGQVKTPDIRQPDALKGIGMPTNEERFMQEFGNDNVAQIKKKMMELIVKSHTTDARGKSMILQILDGMKKSLAIEEGLQSAGGTKPRQTNKKAAEEV